MIVHQNKAGKFTVWISCCVSIKPKSSVLIKIEALFPFGIKHSLSYALLRILKSVSHSQPLYLLKHLSVCF